MTKRNTVRHSLMVCLVAFPLLIALSASVALAEELSAKPDRLYVCIDETKEVTLSGGNFSSQCSVRSADPEVAIATMNAMSKMIEVTGVSMGETTINVTDSDANSVEIKVKVFTIYMSS